jgi:glutamine synthetase
VVKTIAARNGLYASFMPKPILSQSGNGLHITSPFLKNGCNIFKSERNEQAPDAESFIAGVLERACEMSVFLNPLPIPTPVWAASRPEICDLVSPEPVAADPDSRGSREYNRMELRLPDPTCSPYLAFALLIRRVSRNPDEKKDLPFRRFQPVRGEPRRASGDSDDSREPEGSGLLAKNSEFVNNNLPQDAGKLF